MEDRRGIITKATITASLFSLGYSLLLVAFSGFKIGALIIFIPLLFIAHIAVARVYIKIYRRIMESLESIAFNESGKEYPKHKYFEKNMPFEERMMIAMWWPVTMWYLIFEVGKLILIRVFVTVFRDV